MSLPVFQATVVNGTGDLLPAATITVLVEATGQPAVIYSDRNGTVPLGTLGLFSVDVDAFAQFFAAPGNYRVTANDSGSGFSRTWDYVPLVGTAAFVDTGLLTGNVPTADDLSMVGQTINYTGGNYQPDLASGIGSPRFMKNISGGTISNSGSVSGSSLQYAQGSTSGALFGANTPNSGAWTNVSGANLSANEFGLFVRVS